MEKSMFEPGQKFRFSQSVDYSTGSDWSGGILPVAPFDAMVQIIEGKAEIIINKIPAMVEEGETIIMPANIPHAVNAVEKFKMILTMIKG